MLNRCSHPGCQRIRRIVKKAASVKFLVLKTQQWFESLPPSQIQVATPNSFKAMSCAFHFERLRRTLWGVARVSSSNASFIKTLASIDEFESQTDPVHDGSPGVKGR